MFKLSNKLIKENDKINKSSIDLKDYLEFLEMSNKTLKHEIYNIRNLDRTHETCALIKKGVKYLYEILSKFTKRKENLDLILSSQMLSLIKTVLGFKSGRTHSKGFNRKKAN